MPSGYLDILQRRVVHLEGGVVEVQRLIDEMAASERQAASRLGARQPWWTRIPFIPGMPVARAILHTWGSWADFDRDWVARIGPKVRDLASRVSRYEELGLPTARAQYGAATSAERASVEALIRRGNAAATFAERQTIAWRNSPAGAHDDQSSPWYQQWLRRATRGSLLAGAAGEVSGTRSGERFVVEAVTGSRAAIPQGSARATAGRAGTAEEAFVRAGVMAPTSPGQRGMAPRARDEDDSGDGGGGRSPWSMIVTGALVVAGGALVVHIVRSTLASRAAAAAPSEEEET